MHRLSLRVTRQNCLVDRRTTDQNYDVRDVQVTDISAARAHERRMVEAAGRIVCAHWGLSIACIRFPEDERPVPERPLDADVATDGPRVLIEHTMLQSFANQIAQARWFAPVLTLAEGLTGQLPLPGRYELLVDSAELEGRQKADLSGLESWIQTTASSLTAGPEGGPTNVAKGGPPSLPFSVALLRTPPWEGMEGTITVRWSIDSDRLPQQRVEQMLRSLRKKLPKLEEHRENGARTVLVLENRDIQLVNLDVVVESIKGALAEDQSLPVPDAIVMVQLLGGSEGLSWLKADEAWHPELREMYWVPLG